MFVFSSHQDQRNGKTLSTILLLTSKIQSGASLLATPRSCCRKQGYLRRAHPCSLYVTIEYVHCIFFITSYLADITLHSYPCILMVFAQSASDTDQSSPCVIHRSMQTPVHAAVKSFSCDLIRVLLDFNPLRIIFQRYGQNVDFCERQSSISRGTTVLIPGSPLTKTSSKVWWSVSCKWCRWLLMFTKILRVAKSECLRARSGSIFFAEMCVMKIVEPQPTLLLKIFSLGITPGYYASPSIWSSDL